MDHFDHKNEANESNTVSETAYDQTHALPPPATPSNFYKEFVQFAIFLGVVLVPVYTSFDYMAEGLQAFTADYIVPYRESGTQNTLQHTINKSAARGIVLALLFASFTILFLLRRTFRRNSTNNSVTNSLAVVDRQILLEKNEQIRQLRQRLKNDMVILRTIHNQIYGDNRPRLDFSSIKGKYKVNSSGDLEVYKEITVKADGKEGFLWTFYVVGDQDSQPLEDVSALNFSVAALDRDTSVQYVTIADEGLKKQFVIYFLPLLQPGESRSFTLTYTWPGIFTKLLKTGTASYDWQNRAPSTGSLGNFCAEWIFDNQLGRIDCHNSGSKPSGLKLYRDEETYETRWILEGEQVALGNTPYELTFFAPEIVQARNV